MPPLPGLVPVGRLDAQTTGLLLATNDGELAHRVTHPSSLIEKEYELTLRHPVSQHAMAALAAGPQLDDGPMFPRTSIPCIATGAGRSSASPSTRVVTA